MERNPEGIGNRRFNGMETIDKEIFQHLVLNTQGEAKMVVKAVESADGFVAYSRLHAKYSWRTLARIMRIHKECMCPSQVKDVKLLTSATFQWEDKRNAMLKEMKDPSVPDLWQMAAFLELCPNDIKDQVFLRIDEIKENYAALREKVFGWTANKVEQEKSSGRAPMDIGEVDHSQSAMQSHLDWPGQWQVDEWDINAVGNYCYTCGAVGQIAKDCAKGKGRASTAKASTRVKVRVSTRAPTKARARVSTSVKARAPGGTRAMGTKERAITAARWGTSVPSAGSIGRSIRTRFAPWTSRRRRLTNRWSVRRAGWSCTPSRGFLVQAEQGGRSL